MATITENLHAGNGSKKKFSFKFPYLQEADVKVYLFVTDAWVLKTLKTDLAANDYFLANATTIEFTSAPTAATTDEQTALGDTNNIKIKRLTNSDSLSGTFYPGSAIRSSDLNDNFTQNLYVTQEANNNVTTATTDAAAAVVTADAADDNADDALRATDRLVATTTDDGSTWTLAGNNTNASTDPKGVGYAVTQAEAAVVTADAAEATADAADAIADAAKAQAEVAEAAVSSVLPFTIVANKAALLALTPDEDDIFEVTNTQDMDNSTVGTVSWVTSGGVATTLAALKPNVNWDSGITLKAKKYGTTTDDKRFVFQSYFANDPETKYAPTASPTFTGTPTVPGYAPLASPTFTGTPTVPGYAPLASPTFTGTPTVPGYATLASPTLTGTPAAPTADTSTETTQIATTAFVVAEIADEVGTTVQAYDADTAKLDVDQTWTGAQRGTITTLTSGANVTVDFGDSNNFILTTDDGTIQIDNPTTEVAGQSGSIFIVQGSTTCAAPSWGDQWLFPGGTPPSLTGTTDKIARIDYIVQEVGKIHCVATDDLGATT